MQTSDWEALLAGTTEGPWYVGGKGADGNTYVGNYDPDIGGPAASTGSDDAPLVAAAPDAVAEVIRLRRAITDLRDEYLEHIANYDESTVTHVCYGTAADDLDRILNGDTYD